MHNKSMTINDLIALLEEIKRENGDIPVLLSHDSEGNEYSDLVMGHCVDPIGELQEYSEVTTTCKDSSQNVLVLFPLR